MTILYISSLGPSTIVFHSFREKGILLLSSCFRISLHFGLLRKEKSTAHLAGKKLSLYFIYQFWQLSSHSCITKSEVHGGFCIQFQAKEMNLQEKGKIYPKKLIMIFLTNLICVYNTYKDFIRRLKSENHLNTLELRTRATGKNSSATVLFIWMISTLYSFTHRPKTLCIHQAICSLTKKGRSIFTGSEF